MLDSVGLGKKGQTSFTQACDLILAFSWGKSLLVNVCCLN